ncbi:hypothetical protein DIPPA_18637 [Diplonema papillatum]|nr:hypothetical protein DIPPA_18637 [Diplonema papillatum]
MATTIAGGVLNPAELHRECVRLEHMLHLTEKKVAAKDAELAESWGEIQKLEQTRDKNRNDVDRLLRENKEKQREMTEMNKMCQDMIQDRTDWRGKELSLQRRLDNLTNQSQRFLEDYEEMAERCKKLEVIVKTQDAEIQQHISNRTTLTQKIAEGHHHSPRREKDKDHKAERELEEQAKKLLTAESVATVGMNEARATRVEMQQLKRKMARLEASCARANEACSAYKSGCEALQEEIEHLSKEVGASHLEHQNDRTALLAQLRASESRERELHASMQNIRERDLSVEEAKREVDRLGGREQEALRSENHSLREENRKAHEATLAIRAEYDGYKTKYLQLMKTLQQLREQSDDHRRQASEEIQALNRENAEVFEDYNRVRQERAEVRQQLTSAEARVRELRTQVEEMLLAARAQQQQHHSQGFRGDVPSSIYAANQSLNTTNTSIVTEQQGSPDPSSRGRERGVVALAEHERLKEELESEVMLQRQHATQLQSNNAQLTAQVNMLMRDVAELRRGARGRSGSPGSADAESRRMELLELGNQRLQAQLDAVTRENGEVRDRLAMYEVRSTHHQPEFRPPMPTPPVSPPPPVHNRALSPNSPLTDLQVLLIENQDVHPPPPHPHFLPPHLQQQQQQQQHHQQQHQQQQPPQRHDGAHLPQAHFQQLQQQQQPQAPTVTSPPSEHANYESVVVLWGNILQKLLGKLVDVLKGSNKFRVYLFEKAGGPPPDEAIPIHQCTKYPTALWNKTFEAVSGLKLCLRAIEEKGMTFVAENAVLQRQLGMTGLLPSTGDMPQTSSIGGTDPQHTGGGADVHLAPVGVERGSLFGRGKDEGGKYCLMDHDADTDSTSSSVPGEDLGMCTQLIHDTDTLLREAQGTQPYWGDKRIHDLKQQLHSLQADPLAAAGTPSRASLSMPRQSVGPALPAYAVDTPQQPTYHDYRRDAPPVDEYKESIQRQTHSTYPSHPAYQSSGASPVGLPQHAMQQLSVSPRRAGNNTMRWADPTPSSMNELHMP